MVNKIRKALGFMLLPGSGKQTPAMPEVPHLPEQISSRACPLRGFSDKDKGVQLMLLHGNDEAEVIRSLRSVIVEGERPPRKGNPQEGLNVVVFRGVFGSGGYAVAVRNVQLKGRVLEIECDFENPGSGIRTTAGFTQPTVIVPLKRLPAGKYKVRLMARKVCRSSQGVHEVAPSCEEALITIKIGS